MGLVMYKLLLPQLRKAVKKQIGFNPEKTIFFKEYGKPELQMRCEGEGQIKTETVNPDNEFAHTMNSYSEKVEGVYFRVLLIINFVEKTLDYQIWDTPTEQRKVEEKLQQPLLNVKK